MGLHIGVVSRKSTTMGLNKAILLYGQGNASYASIHNVQGDQATGMTIGAGKPATVKALAHLATGLIKNASFGSFLPENVLSVGIDSITWWLPPCKSRLVWFKTNNEQIGTISGRTPQVGLVFRVSGHVWQVFAVKGNKRPTPDTQLNQAPFLNVYDDGHICVGNVTTPKGTTAETLAGWENAFFNSYFTHPNSMKLVKFKGGCFAFWSDMLAGKFKSFPEKVLFELKATLDDLISGRKFNI